MSMSQIATSSFNIVWEAPTYTIGGDASQNFQTNPNLLLTPGTAQPLRFTWGGRYGERLNLNGFSVRFLVWKTPRFDVDAHGPSFSLARGETIFEAPCVVDDPYTGECHLVLSVLDVETIVQQGGTRWTVLLDNNRSYVFTGDFGGQRYGNIIVDQAGLPPAGVILR